MRRQAFHAAVTETVEGITTLSTEELGRLPKAHWHGADGDVDVVAPTVITDRLRRTRALATEEFTYARARTDKPIKVTLVSPLMLSVFWQPGRSDRVYDDAFEAFRDGATIVRQEIAELAAIGCEYIQIDAPELVSHTLTQQQRDYWTSVGVDPNRLLGEGVELLNDLVAGFPEIYFALHVCRGNAFGMWMSEGGYDSVARQIFENVPNYDALALEYDTPRAGSLGALRDVPDDKVVILGLVSTKSDEMESAEELTGRIDEAARHFPREQLAVSTQCGFASAAMGNPIAWETQERKQEIFSRSWHGAVELDDELIGNLVRCGVRAFVDGYGAR